MFGLFIGTVSLIGLMKVWRRGRSGAGGYGYRGGGPRRWMLRKLFERLDTTPGQEKVVMAAVDDVQRKAWSARSGLFAARGEVAKALRTETFDSAAINEVLEKQQAALDELKKSVREGLQSIHEAMSPEQRGHLADLVEFGPARFHQGGHAWGHGFHRGHHGRGHQAESVNL